MRNFKLLPARSAPRPTEPDAVRKRPDVSIRDSVRLLSEVVTQLSERIDILEARELLSRAR